MDLFKARCGCGAIVSLPSLKARAVSCDACARKRSAALNEARAKPTAWTGTLEYFRWDKWEQQAPSSRHVTGAAACVTFDGYQSKLIRHASTPPNIVAWYLPAGTATELYVPDDFDVNVHTARAAPSLVDGYWSASGPGNVWLTKREEKPAKRPFAVGDRVVVNSISGTQVTGCRTATVFEGLRDKLEVKMDGLHYCNGAWDGGFWSVQPEDLEHV